MTVDDVHVETYEGKNGTGTKLVGRVSDIELAGGAPSEKVAPVAAKEVAERKSASASSGFADMDDDIPF